MSIVGGSGSAAQDSLSILQLIASDPKKFQQEVKRFEEARAAAEEKLKLLGVAGDITAIRAQAQLERNNAESTLRDAVQQLSRARDEAAAVVANANLQAASIRAKAEDDAKMLRASADKTIAESTSMRKKAEESERAAVARNLELSRQAAGLKDRESAIEGERAKARQTIELYMSRRAVLEGVMTTIAGTLNVDNSR